jgi:hypothetical protein
MRQRREIKWQPGRWIDFSGGKTAVRDADGKIIAEDLMVDEAGIKVLANALADQLNLSGDEKEAFLGRVRERFNLDGGQS